MALNDVRLTVRDRAAFVWMLLMPIAFMWIFGAAFRDSSEPPRIALTVVDRDGGWLARALVEELEDETVNLTELTPEEASAAENKVRSLIIPEGFTANALVGKQQTLRFEREAGSNQEFGLAGQMHVVRSIVRAVGRLIEMRPSAEQASDETAGRRFRELGERPALVKLAVSDAGTGRRVPSGFSQSVPGILTMVVLMMTLIYGAVFLTIEKRDGLLRRQTALPVTRMQIYLGKLGGRMLLAMLQLAMLAVLGTLLFDFSWGNSPLGVAIVLLSFAAAVSGLATMLGALLRTPDQASAVGWILSMFLAGIGGCWWPSEVMPRWMQTAGHALPTAWTMDALHALISFGRGVEGVWLPSLALLGFGTLFGILGTRFLRDS